MVQTTITSLEETQNLGKKFATRIHSSNIIALYGDLGAGKTTFTQGFAEGLGIKQRIISPTFIVVRAYNIKYQKFKMFYHIDLYRIENSDNIQDLGISEIMNDPGNIVVIEWARKMGDLLPNKRWDIHMDYINEKSRKIQIELTSS